ncbi:MAG: sulfotransferase domain-containing protein [Actinomycetes bacterium]
MLPTFAVIGAMKAGTTAVYRGLSDHPDVFMCTPKEPQFFTTRWERGLHWYEGLFAAAGNALARGDASTSYTDFPRKSDAARRMALIVPDIRLVYVVRDPVARMRSHYRHRVAQGVETRPIERALLDERYLLRSSYALQIEQYAAKFPRSQLLVLDAADLLAGGTSWSRLFEFIGVGALDAAPLLPRANETAARLEMRPAARALRQRAKGTTLYRLAPARARTVARRFGRRPPSEHDDATISADLCAEIRARLHDDVEQFAEMTGIRFKET